MPSFTRKAIMNAFLELLDERPLSKITIRDIVDRCGVNRNTFYYHFEDIPALIEAIVRDEADQLTREHSSVSSMEEMLDIAVSAILKYRRAALHIYNSANRDVYEQYLMQICHYVVARYFDTLTQERPVNAADRQLILHCYSCWCFGLITDWLNNGLREDIRPELNRLCALHSNVLLEVLELCEKQ